MDKKRKRRFPHSFKFSSNKNLPSKNCNVLKYASEESKRNEKVVLAAVKQNGNALEYASEELKCNEKVVLAAVKQNGKALEYASKGILNKKIVLAAIDNGFDLNYLYKVEKVLNSKIKEKESSLEEGEIDDYIDTLRNKFSNICRILEDREIILASVKTNGHFLQKAIKFQDDIEIVTQAVKTNGSALQHASEDLKGNKQVVLAAVSKNCNAILQASQELRNDITILSAAVRQNPLAKKFVPEELRNKLI